MLSAGELARLAAAGESLPQREANAFARLAAACRRSVTAHADAWVAASQRAKGWQDQPHAAAEEWASGPLPVARFLALLEARYRDLASGRDRAPLQRGDHFLTLPAAGLADGLLLRGYRAELIGDAGSTAHRPHHRGGLAVVLGAGNVTSTPLLDVLQQVFWHGRAVVLKCSPLHAALRPHFEAALAPLHDAGLLRLVSGDADVGGDLARDARVTAVHLTGSTATWLSLRADSRLQGKELTGEVGCVTPVLVVPGEWRDAELRFVARQLAAFTAMNGGATCLAPRLLLTPRVWPQRRALLDHLRQALAALPARIPFHPAATAAFAIATGTAPPMALPPTLRRDLDLQRDAALLRHEHFTPVLLELPLDGDDAATFCTHAADAVRAHVYGALSAYVFAPPRVLARERGVVTRTIERLPHGTVAINTWTGLGYGLGNTPWGVPDDAAREHGAGWSRGTAGVAPVRRCVIEAPFRPRPLPPWLPDHRAGAATLRALTRFYLQPGPLRLANVLCRGMLSP